MSAGAICAETITGATSDMTFDDYIDFLVPKPERPDPDRPGHTLPARAGAMCQSADDWNENMKALEQACRMLGSKCSPEAKQILENFGYNGGTSNDGE